MSNQLILKAARFAAHKHRNQRRKDEEKTPYINHPISVAKIISEIGKIEAPEVLAAALLHDTLEDTKTTPEELIDNFGERVCNLVQEVTDDKTLPKLERKQRQIDHAKEISGDDAPDNIKRNQSYSVIRIPCKYQELINQLKHKYEIELIKNKYEIIQC